MLKIAEINKNQTTHGIALMCPSDMKQLDINNGDTICILAKRQVVVKVLSDESNNVKKGTLQISATIKENCYANIGESFEIEKIKTAPAKSITIIPSLEFRQFFKTEKDEKNHLKKLLNKFKNNDSNVENVLKYRKIVDGVPVMTGDKIRVYLFGRAFDFDVLNTVPDGAVEFNDQTKINIVGGSKIYSNSLTSVAYEDIGGLEKEVSKVKEIVELPMKFPQVFEQLGVEPPKGLLLYGPPGCGKTLIARAVARESGVHFINVNAAEIIQQHYGASEQKIRDIFDEAQAYAPSILFIDEIDALAPNRETVLGDVEKRVVSQLLTLMDGLNSRGQIVVIAATNIPNNIDPALRRPGRFDREIGINPPDKQGREEILRIHTRGMPLDNDVNLSEISDITPGFIGADIAALCREAAMVCIRDFLPDCDNTNTILSEDVLENIKVSMKHFEKALSEIELSTTRQISTEIASVKWDDVGGLENIKDVLKDTVELPLKYSKKFKQANIRPPKGILLTGKSGTGKTLIARAIASESNVNFISVKGPELLSKWVGESERGIREIFKKARQSSPSIIFFDEIDAIIPERGKGEGSSNISERMVGQFLLEMDNIDSSQNVIVLAATNRPDLIDKALLRPGRFDIILKLPMPDYETRLSILKIYCKGRVLKSDVILENLAERTEGMTGADLEAICQRAAMLSFKDSIKINNSDLVQIEINNNHFQLAMENLSQNLK